MPLFEDFYEIKKFDIACNFLRNVYVKKVLSSIIGLLISNPPIIIFHKLFDDHGFLSNKKNIKILQDEIKLIIYKILPKLLIFGFVSYYKADTEDITIDVINYKNGKLYYKINEKTKKISLHWVWDTKKNSKLVRKLTIHNNEDKNVKHCIIDEPDFKGNLTAWLSPFIEKDEKIRLLEKFQIDIEKAKWNNHFYIQKTMPELDPEKYDAFQNHAFLVNTNPNEIDDPRKRFYNMHRINRRIEYFEDDWKKRTEELIGKYFNMKNFQEIQKDKSSGNFIVGELAKLIFPPVNNYGPLLDNLRQEFKEVISDMFGFSEISSKALKDQARMQGFLVRTNTAKIQIVLEKALTKIGNDMIKPIITVFAKQKIKDLRRKVKENPQKPIEIPDIEDLENITIELDPIIYLNGGELEMMTNYNLSLKDWLKISFGSEIDFIEGAETMFPISKSLKKSVSEEEKSTK